MAEKAFVGLARQVAYAAHEKQKDKQGRPYKEHLAAVAAGVRVLGGSPEAVAAAYLHDILEDTKTTVVNLIDLGFPHAVVRAVVAVTKAHSQEQNNYLEQIIKGGEDAIMVKVADLLHNLRHDRLSSLPEYTQTRLLKKYRPSLARLLMELGLIATQDVQDKLATKPVGSTTYWSSEWTAGGGTVNKKYADNSVEYSAKALMEGDWPATWPAPIKKRLREEGAWTIYLLTNGKERKAVGTYRLWTKYQLEREQAKDPKFNPAFEPLYYVSKTEKKSKPTKTDGEPKKSAGAK